MILEIEKQNIKTLSKSDLKVLIDQLENGMSDILTCGDLVRANKLNILLGKCIDLYIKK